MKAPSPGRPRASRACPSGLAQQISNPAPYIGCAIAVLVSSALVMLVPRSLGRAHVGPETRPATLRDAFGGIRLILASSALLGAISLDLAAVLFGGVYALLPVFSSDILHVGALGNGILRAAPGAGAVVVGLVLSVRPVRRRVGPTLFMAVSLYGVFTIVFGVSRSFALSLVALAALAGADMFSVLIRSSPCSRCSRRRRCAGASAPSSGCSSAARTSSGPSSRASPRR